MFTVSIPCVIGDFTSAIFGTALTVGGVAADASAESAGLSNQKRLRSNGYVGSETRSRLSPRWSAGQSGLSPAFHSAPKAVKSALKSPSPEKPSDSEETMT